MRKVIIVAICILSIFAGWGIAHAHGYPTLPEILDAACDTESSVFVVGRVAHDLGYDNGIGVYAEQRLKVLGLLGFVVHGSVANQFKQGADSGTTYGFGGHVRAYVWNPFYVGAGYSWTGYRSTFPDGTVWAKRGGSPDLLAGYETPDADLSLTYSLREHDTLNEVASLTVTWRQRIYRLLHSRLSLSRSDFNQDGERRSGWSGTIGVGIVW